MARLAAQRAVTSLRPSTAAACAVRPLVPAVHGLAAARSRTSSATLPPITGHWLIESIGGSPAFAAGSSAASTPASAHRVAYLRGSIGLCAAFKCRTTASKSLRPAAAAALSDPQCARCDVATYNVTCKIHRTTCIQQPRRDHAHQSAIWMYASSSVPRFAAGKNPPDTNALTRMPPCTRRNNCGY
jgi:hypothetical protein